MDLRHDWKALNDVLFPQDRDRPFGGSSVVMLEDGGKVVDGLVSNGTALDLESDLFKSELRLNGSLDMTALDSIATKYGVDKTIVLSKRALDQFVIEAAQLGTNYFQQLQMLRDKIVHADSTNQEKGSTLVVSRKHFVLDLFGKQLRRFLPQRFNVVIMIDQRSSLPHNSPTTTFSYQAILLSYSKGQLDQFFEPDFASLHEGRLVDWAKQSDAIGEYLENRYLMPCYGIFMYKDVWERCLEAATDGKRDPWRLFVRYYDDARASVYPRGILIKSLLALQRVMVYFGRP
jgi:hypothetical protein